MKPIIAILVVCLLLAAGIYATRITDADPKTNQLKPQVDGRLVGIIFADFAPDGTSATILCESDAVVSLEGSVVTEVIHQGDRPKVQPGDEIAESSNVPTREGVTPRETGRSGGKIFDRVQVYWGDDGRLHRGCAPESARFEQVDPTPPGAAQPLFP